MTNTPLHQAASDAKELLTQANRDWTSCKCANELCEHHASWLKAQLWYSQTAELLMHSSEPREWKIRVDEYDEEPFIGSPTDVHDHALALLGDPIPGSNVAIGTQGQLTTSFHLLRWHCELTGETEYAAITIHPAPPPCTGETHEWQRPFEIVGGIEDNPGVISTTAGTITVECCMVCGCKCETNTGVYNPAAQTYGNTAISFAPKFFAEEIAR